MNKVQFRLDDDPEVFEGERVEPGDIFDVISYWVPSRVDHRMIFLASDGIWEKVK